MRTRRAPRPAAAGYTLVALVVIVAVMSVLVGAALPYWSKIIQRDKDAELIFRGLQYAEAIRVFRLRFNRLPNTLDELIEVNPRSIRRLWKDPMTEDGEWELIRAQGAQRAGQQRARGRELTAAAGPRQAGPRQSGRPLPTGPIIGVRSRSEEGSLRSFMGSTSYSDWQFTAELIPTPVTLPDTLLVPRPTSDWIGKPFREGLEPKPGGMPGGGPVAGTRRPGDDDG